jgi:hypothetical protein
MTCISGRAGPIVSQKGAQAAGPCGGGISRPGAPRHPETILHEELGASGFPGKAPWYEESAKPLLAIKGSENGGVKKWVLLNRCRDSSSSSCKVRMRSVPCPLPEHDDVRRIQGFPGGRLPYITNKRQGCWQQGGVFIIVLATLWKASLRAEDSLPRR